MRSKQRKSRAVLQWRESTQRQREKLQLVKRAASSCRRRLFAKWATAAARQKRNRRVLADAELRRNLEFVRAASELWQLGARRQRQQGQCLAAALQSALKGHMRRAVLTWKVYRLLQCRRWQALHGSLLAWQLLACRLRTARLRAEGPLRLVAISKVSAFAFDAWAWCVADGRAERLRSKYLHLALQKGSLRPAFQLWRTQLLVFKALRAFIAEALPTCLRAWRRFLHRKVEARRRVAAAAVELARRRAMQRWHARCNASMHLKKLRIQAVLATSNWCIVRALQAWRRCQRASAEERQWLAKRASFMQWKKWLKRRLALKTAFIEALRTGAVHNQKRLARQALRWWSWTTAWNSANLEASARLVQESRKFRERRQRQRRQVVGPLEEELQLLETGFRAWCSFTRNFLRVLQQTSRQVAREHGALLLLSLDHWVEATLPTRRAENLQRRRHVRFNMTSAPRVKPEEASGRRKSSPPSSERKRSSSLSVTRRLSAGPLGQWAQSATPFQVATAKGAVLDGLAPPSTLTRQESEEIQVVFAGEASGDSSDIVSPGSLTSPTRFLRNAPVPAAAVPKETKTSEEPSAAKVANGRSSGAEGTGGTSTPSAFDTPVRHPPSPKGDLLEQRRSSEPAVGGNSLQLHQPQVSTYVPLALPLPPMPTATKMVPLHLRNEEPLAALPAPPKIGEDLLEKRRASAPASTVSRAANSDILRFFKMRS